MQTINIRGQNILLLSDTHGRHRRIDVPGHVDIVIHCGDICSDGNMDEISDFFLWYSGLQIAHKVFVHGNHDWPFEIDPEYGRALVPENVRWPGSRAVTLNGVKLKALDPFALHQDVDKYVDILISHYPPLGILDGGFGSAEVRDYALQAAPRYCVFGHYHAGYGCMDYQNIRFINASLYNELG